MGSSQTESNLEVAARWSYLEIVVYLLKARRWNRKELTRARVTTENKDIRALLYASIRKIKKKEAKSCCFMQ